MKEIKLRVWDKLKSVWTNYQIQDDMMHAMDKYTGVWYRVKDCKRFLFISSTGLRDKSGKEIFEGDIVEMDEGVFTWIDKVDYHLGCFMVDENALAAIHNNCEVIGNAYENPELIK